MDLSDDQKSNNYQHLKNTLAYIEFKGRITEDWMCEQIKFIRHLRCMYPNISLVSLEITEREFRARACDAELLLQTLCDEIKHLGIITIETYYEFCKNIEYIVDASFADDELCDLFSKI